MESYLKDDVMLPYNMYYLTKVCRVLILRFIFTNDCGRAKPYDDIELLCESLKFPTTSYATLQLRTWGATKNGRRYIQRDSPLSTV